MKFKIIFMIVMFLLMVNVVDATDGLTECTLTGNHYQCTGTISGHDSFVTDKSIHIFDATITLGGSTGGTASAGESVSMLIESTVGKILIERSTITVTGGAGGAGDGATGNADGGAGGTGTLNITSDYVDIENSTLTTRGGSGGNGVGDSNPSSCTYDEEGIGGAGAASYLYLYGNVELILDNITVDGNSGNGGTASVEACTRVTGSVRVDCYAADGGSSGHVYTYLYYDTLTATDLTIDGQPGNGGNGAAATCTYDSGDSNDADNDQASGTGGLLGGVLTYFSGDSTNINGADVDYFFGTSFASQVVSRAEAPDGTTELVAAADRGAYATSVHIFSIITDNLTMDDSTFDVTGAAGYDADADTDIDTGSTTPGTDRAEGLGGDGQGYTMTLYATTSGTVTDTNITITGGNGGIQDCGALDDNSNEDCGTYSGDGGHITYNIKNINLSNVDIVSTGGVGASDGTDEGAGGNGGNNVFNNYETSYIDTNSFIDFNGGAGGTGCGVNYGICAPGKGGDAYVYNYGSLTINGWMDFDGGACGTGSICRAILYVEQGGDTAFDNNDTLNFVGANVDLNAGTDSASCGVGGNAFIDSSDYLKIYSGTDIAGVGGVGAGDCESDFQGIVQIEDSSYSCAAATGTSAWVGVNMTQVDFRANSSITMSGSIDNNIDFTYTGSNQKFLIYNSTFDATGINWLDGSCKFTNRTPASVGTVTFNESCSNEVGWDNYYTDINSVEQSWSYGATSKPLPYSYTNYTCTANVDFPSDVIGAIYGDILWYVNNVFIQSEHAAEFTSSTDYVSTSILSSVSIDDNVTCKLNVFSNATLTNYCYQEFANESTSCGGLGTGTYVDDGVWSGSEGYKTYDGDYSTLGIGLWLNTEGGKTYINYTIPDYASNNSLWQIKTGDTPTPVTQNLTIPSACWSQTPLQFYMVSWNGAVSAEHVNASCYNGTDWQVLNSTNTFDASPNVYEEGMYWLFGDLLTNLSDIDVVVPAYPYNAKIDVGADGTYEYEGVGVFNSTLADTYVKNGINAYIRDCTTSTCNVPIAFSSDENSTWVFNQVNSSYGVSSPISGLFNLSLALFSSEAGIVNVNSLLFDYGISDGDNVSFVVPFNSTVDTTRIATIVVSNFTQSLPLNTLFFEMYPERITSQNVEPVGQTSSIPVFTVTNNHATEAVDVYIKLEDDWDVMNLPCTELEFVTTSSSGSGVEINDTSYLYCDNVSVGGTCELWAYQDFNCTYSQAVNAVYQPNFVFDAICEDCVVSVGVFD